MTAAATIDGTEIIGRYALYGEIASGGMATVHFGRLLGSGRASRAPSPSSAFTRSSRATPSSSPCSSTRRGSPRASATPTWSRRSTSWRPTASSFSSWSTCTASRSRACSCGARARRARPAADRRGDHDRASLHGLHAAHEANDRDAGSRSTSCTATCRRRTSSSAPTAWRASSTSASPRRAGAPRRPRARASVKGKLAYMAPEQLARGARRRPARRRLRGGGRPLGDAHRQAALRRRGRAARCS